MDWFSAFVKNNELSLEKGVYKSRQNEYEIFADRYIALRTRENRFYNDDELLHLPSVVSGHSHYHEWKIRKKNAIFLRDFINRDNRQQLILEIGAGNGWLSNFLASKNNHTIISQDINITEFEQASRVFKNPSIKWICASLETLNFPDKIFDHIIFASSLQYFKEPEKLFEQLNSYLKQKGRIHIIDSPLYTTRQSALAAAERTKAYYSGSGFPELALNYHHHCMDIFQNREIIIHQKPQNSFLKRFLRIEQPFYWISTGNH